MSTFFRSMFGAAVLVAASSASVFAQDYTWTLQNFRFGDYFDGGPVFQGVETTSTASGNFVLTKVGVGFELKSFNFTTTADGFSGTGFAATYNSAVIGLYGTDELPSDKFDTYLQMAGIATNPEDTTTEYTFRLTWDNAALLDSMNAFGGAGELGAVIPLIGPDTFEYDGNGNFTRYNNADPLNVPPAAFTSGRISAPAFPAQLQLTAVPVVVSTPEPASLALLGTGLLGIFAARRRKAV